MKGINEMVSEEADRLYREQPNLDYVKCIEMAEAMYAEAYMLDMEVDND